MNFVQGETEIRKEFSKLDTDNSGYITKGIYLVFLDLDIDTVTNTQYCSKHLAKIVHTVKCKSAVRRYTVFFLYKKRVKILCINHSNNVKI